MRTPFLALVLSSVTFCYEGPWQPVVYDYYHIDLSELGGHPHFDGNFEVPHQHGGKSPIPRDAIVDVINELGIKLLAIHNERNENNIAISPYGAFSVLAALTEGLQGEAAHEILHAAHIPKDKHVLRVGLRDIHRHLKSYFIPEEGFLAGLTLNLNNVTLKSEYEDVLHFYGFDYGSFNNALYPEPPTTKKPAEGTTLETGLTISEEETTTVITTEKTEEITKEISTRVGGSSSERTIADTTSTTESQSTITSTSLPKTTTTQPPAATTTELFSTVEATTTNKPEITTENSPATTTVTATATTTIPSTTAIETTTKIPETTTLITTLTETTTKIPETTTLITTLTETTTKIPETTTLITTPTETTTKIPETTIIITTTEITKPPETTTIMTTSQDTETTTTKLPETTTLPPTTTETTLMPTTTPIRTTREVTTISTMPELTTTIEAVATEDQLLEDLETTTPFFFETTPEFQEVPQNTNFDFNYNNYDANNVPPVYDENNVLPNNNVPETENNNFKRQARSVVDYVIARFHDGHHHYAVPPPRPQYIPREPLTFAVYGKFRESGINFMKYDTVLPYFYVQNLNAIALSFPLDSSKYYLLLLLPVGDNGVDQLICDLRLHGNLRYIIDNLKLTHVVATIPSFMLKGYVTLTPALQRLGIRKIFEPRQADFSPMTNETDIYVTNIEQAVTVTIRNYLDPSSQRYKNFQQYPPVYFKADHPFLYFVIDSELHVALMVGKVINPLNSRIR